MLNNPILARELKFTLRSPVTVMLAGAYLGVLAVLLWWMWPQEGIYSVAAQSSRSLLLVFSVAQLLLAMLYAPAFAATAITSEKERNTYDMLFSTLLKPGEIAVGKLASSIAALLVFVVLSLPLFAACFFLGAVSVREAVVIYGVTVASSVLFGLLGLAVSSVLRSSQMALVTTYLLLLLLNAGPWLPYLLLQQKPWAAGFIYQARAFSPLAAMASVVLPAFQPAGAWQGYLVFCAVASGVLLVLVVGRVYWAGQRNTRRHGRAIDDAEELRQRKLRFPFYLIDPMRRKGNIPDWLNPMFAKELRSQAFGGGVWIFRSAYACFGLSMLMMVGAVGNLVGPTPNLIRSVALVFQLGLIVLIVPSLTAGAITQERERGSMELLRLSRLGPLSFLVGKVAVALLFVVFLILGAVPGWFALHYLEINTLKEILIVWAVIGTSIGLALATGLFSSAVAPRTPVATALAYGLMFVVAVATLLPLLAADQMSVRLRELVFTVNPFVPALQVLTRGIFDDLGEMWRAHLQFAGVTAGVFLVVAYVRLRGMLLPQK